MYYFSITLPSTSEYKAKLEEQFTSFSDYFVVLFAVTALVFVIKGIVS